MTRNLRVLGLALFAAFTMSAAMAPGARAEEQTGQFSWDTGTTKLTTEEDPTAPIGIFKFRPGALNLELTCNINHGEAQVTGNGNSTVKAEHISYGCTGTGGVNMNGCIFILHAGTTIETSPVGRTEGTLTLLCPEGPIQVKIELPGCMIRLSSQEALGPVYYSTVTEPVEHFTSEARIGEVPGAAHNKAITYSTSGTLCGVHNETDGEYTGTFTTTAFNQNKERTNLTVT